MYKSLYRIYRPKRFEDSVGQEYIVKILQNQLIENKVGHAYLFTGVRGTGKTTFAKILAKAVNCLNLQNGEPCLECENCKGIEEGSILDVIEMDAASNTGVDNIREIIDEANYLPTKAKYRVYIIDEVHMLSSGAFNALLKTLEEPPRHVKFILATTEPQKLPATILSRCQRFDFKKVSINILSDYLEKIAKDAGIEITKDALNLIASLGEGSVRDSISILESAKSLENKIEEKDIRSIIGIPDVDLVIDIILHILEGNEIKASTLVSNILNEGKETKSLVEEMIRILEIAFIKEEEKLFRCSSGEKNKIAIIAKKNKDDVYFLLKQLLEIENNLRWTEKKNTIFLASIIDLSMYFKKEIIEEKNSMDAEEILNILNNKTDAKNAEEIKKETVQQEEENKKTSKNIESNDFKKANLEKEDKKNIDLTKANKYNIINIQKALTKKGEMQIFAFISNSEAYIQEDKFYFVKKNQLK